MEEWKDIEGYQFYQVSNKQRVRSIDRTVGTVRGNWCYKGKILSQTLSNSGYYIVRIKNNNGEWKHMKVHRLVGIAFIPKPEHLKDVPFENLEIDHDNTIRNDNSIANLFWKTRLENQNNPLTIQHLKESHKTQLNKNLMKKVHQYTLDGEFVAEFACPNDAAESVGCARSSITKACRDNIPIKGYIWKYTNKKEVSN